MTFAAQPHYYLYIYNNSCLRAQRVCEAHSRNPDQNTSKHRIFPSAEPDLKPWVAAAVGTRYKGFHSNQLVLFSASSRSPLVIQYESVISWRVSSEPRRFLFVLWMQWEDSTTSVFPSCVRFCPYYSVKTHICVSVPTLSLFQTNLSPVKVVRAHLDPCHWSCFVQGRSRFIKNHITSPLKAHYWTQTYTYTWVTALSNAVIHPHMHTADLSGSGWWLNLVLIMFDGNISTDFHKHGPSHTHSVIANVHRHEHMELRLLRWSHYSLAGYTSHS